MSKSNEEKKVNKWTVLIIVISMTFMATLDGSIVNVALPSMARVLNVTTSSIQFVATVYLIVVAGIILVFGKLGDLFGKTKMFTLGVAIFTIGSLLCGLSGSYLVLILARVVQAIGAAGAMANNQGIITETFPPNERGKALGIVGTAVALGSLVGPGLGGIIVGAIGWEYIFFINVPIGLIAVIAAIRYLPQAEKKRDQKLDIPGAVLFLTAIVPLFVSLSEGVSRGFTDGWILAGFAVAAVSFVAFIIVEKKKKDPLVQFDMFSDQLFSLSIFCGFISFVAIFCHSILLPFYLQDVRAYDPLTSGLIMMAYPLILSAVAPLSGQLSDKIGSEVLTFLGLCLTSTGLFLMVGMKEDTRILYLILAIAVMSVGMGMFQSPNNSLVMSTVSRDKLGVAGSINALVRNMGMVCGIALATTLLYGMMSYKIGRPVSSYIPGRSDAFIFGMHVVYIAAGCTSLIGAVLTFLRLVFKKQRNMEQECVGD